MKNLNSVLRRQRLSELCRILVQCTSNSLNTYTCDIYFDYSPRHILHFSTKCVQGGHLIDTCKKSIFNRIDPNSFGLNSSNLTSSSFKSSQIELGHIQTIQEFLLYKYLITVPEGFRSRNYKKHWKIIDHISSEMLKRLQCMQNVIVYNIINSANLNSTKNTVL